MNNDLFTQKYHQAGKYHNKNEHSKNWNIPISELVRHERNCNTHASVDSSQAYPFVCITCHNQKECFKSILFDLLNWRKAPKIAIAKKHNDDKNTKVASIEKSNCNILYYFKNKSQTNNFLPI